MKNKQLFKKNIRERGVLRQIDKCIEECSELILELEKFKYGHSTCEKVAGELADVHITCKQIILIVGIKVFKEMLTFKTKRLSRRLKKLIKCKKEGVKIEMMNFTPMGRRRKDEKRR